MSSSSFDVGEGVDASRVAEAVDVAVVQVLKACGEPFFLAVAEHELQEAGEIVQVLAGVVKIDDLGGLDHDDRRDDRGDRSDDRGDRGDDRQDRRRRGPGPFR